MTSDPKADIEQKVIPAVNRAVECFSGLTVGQSLLAIQTLAAHVLSQKEKSVENEFIKRLKRDILERRVKLIREKSHVKH